LLEHPGESFREGEIMRNITKDAYRKEIKIAPLMGFPGIQLTKTNISQNMEDAEIQIQSLEALYKKYAPDAMFMMMDLTVEAEALGLKILKPQNAAYSVAEHPVRDGVDLGKLRVPNPQRDGRMPLMSEIIKRMKLSFNCPGIAYAIGPFTLAGLLNGSNNVLKNVIKNPGLLHQILNFSSKVIDGYVGNLIEAGADLICILEPTATMLSPGQFREFSAEYLQGLEKKWNFPFILHICGDATHLVPQMVATGCVGVSFDSMVDLGEIAALVPDEMMIIGNINPVEIIAYGDQAQVMKAVASLLGQMDRKDNFVLSSGCDLPPETNLDNLTIFFDTARQTLSRR
jgi:uroporphyrinogen decarboxylase